MPETCGLKTQAELPCAECCFLLQTLCPAFPPAVETRPRQYPHLAPFWTEHATLLYSLERSAPASLQKCFFRGCTEFLALIDTDVTFLPLTSPSYRSQAFRPAATEGTGSH